MDWAKEIVLEIATVSLRVVSAATLYAKRRGVKKVQLCHFRLEKEMHKISVAARGILDALDKFSISNGPPLDDRLEEWFSSDELPTCVGTLNEMETMLQNNDVSKPVNSLSSSSSPREDKIDFAAKLFDSRRNYFHFLLTTDIWNCERTQQQPRTRLAYPQNSGPVPEPSILCAMEVDQDSASVPPSPVARPTIVVEKDKKRNIKDDRKKIDDILHWLDGLSCAAKQEETLSLRQPDTCTWLGSTPEYESWRNSDDSSLWLQGKPGSGKTVLASFVIDSLKNRRRDGKPMAYFYCDFRSDRSASAAEVMRSIISQMLHHVRDEKVAFGESLDVLEREIDRDVPIFKNVKRLATFASHIAKTFDHHPLVIVDALDECRDVKELLDGLLILTKSSIRLFATSRPLQIIKDALRGLPTISMDKMTAAMSTDISLHVTRELDSRRRLRDLESDFKMEIKSVLCDRADGMFRWVQCQIDTLNQCATKAEVRAALSNLPLGLDETYQRILTLINTESADGKLAMRVLVLLVGALRPLRLREILDGLAVDLEKQTLELEIGPLHVGILLEACGSLVTYGEDTDILILSHFSVKEYLTGALIRTKLPRYHINYQIAHRHLACLCLCYTTLYLNHVHRSAYETSLSHILRTIKGRPEEAAEKRSQFPIDHSDVLSHSSELLGYTFSHGFHHLAYLGSADRIVLKDMKVLQLDIQRYPDAWDTILRMSRYHNSSIPWPAREHDFMLYVLTAFASPSLLRAFLGHDHKVFQPKHQTNPLVYAAHFDKAQHAQIMLSRGAKVNDKGLVVDGSRQALPLETAVVQRHDVIVDLLLSAGSMVPKGVFALSFHDFRFSVRVVRNLLRTDQFAEWAAEPGSELPSLCDILRLRLPLEYESEIIFIVRKLVQAGVTHAEDDWDPDTALNLAIQGKYQAIVAYLLLLGTQLPSDFISALSKLAPTEQIPMLRLIVETGADDIHGGTALHLAIRKLSGSICLEAVKILLGAGCSILGRDGAGKTPLHHALENRKTSVADYLLSKGTPTSDALLAVMESPCATSWRLQALRALVQRGANLDGIVCREDAISVPPTVSLLGNRRRTGLASLHNASCGPHESVGPAVSLKPPVLLEWLLSTGESPPPDALFAILQSELPTVVKALTVYSLIGKGSDVGSLSTDGSTLLHVAVLALDENGALDVVKCLVKAGCDPFRRNSQGKISLDLALDRKYFVLTDYLFSVRRPPPLDTLFALLRSTLPTQHKVLKLYASVEQGTDVHGLSADGNTLLHAVVLALDESRALDATKHLIRAGCDPFQCNLRGKIALDLAMDRGYPLLVEFLLSKVGKPPPCNVASALLQSKLLDNFKTQMVRLLIDKGIDVQASSNDGNTLLHDTISTFDESMALDLARCLADAGCHPFQCNLQGKTPLDLALDREYALLAVFLLSVERPPPNTVFAILKSRLPINSKALAVNSFIEAGLEVCELSADGNTLLHAVVLALDESRALDVAKYFVGAACDLFQRNLRGKTALDLAVDRGYPLLVEFLLSKVEKPPPCNVAFALLQSKLLDNFKAQMIHLLIDKGIDVQASSNDGNTLLHDTISAFDEGMALDLAKRLAGAGCDPFQCNLQEKTPLDLALNRDYTLIAESLLSIGRPPPPDALFAILKSRLPTNSKALAINSFIEEGLEACELSADGNTLLHAAVLALDREHAYVIERLVSVGCDPFKRNIHGKTPLDFAWYWPENSIELANHLLSAIKPRALPVDALFSILKNPFPHGWMVEKIRSLVHAGAVPSVCSTERFSLFQATLGLSEEKALEVVKVLVGAGCDLSAGSEEGETALYVAAKEGYFSIVEYFLSLNQPLPDDILFFLLTSWQRRDSLMSILRTLTTNFGANTRFVEADGDNLLHVAIRVGHETAVVKFLVDSGCNPHATNYYGETPFHIAVARRSVAVAEYLLSISSVSLPNNILLYAFPKYPSQCFSSVDMFELLIRKGANVHVQADDGDTPLHKSIKCYHRFHGYRSEWDIQTFLDIVRLLVDSGCDPSWCDADGHPAVYSAIAEDGCAGVIGYLLPRTSTHPWRLWGAVDDGQDDKDELKEMLTKWFLPA